MTSMPDTRPNLTPIDAASSWRRELSRAYASVPELLGALGLDPNRAGAPERILADFPLRVPRGFVARMRARDFSDPLLRQVLPVADEARDVPGFVADPVGVPRTHLEGPHDAHSQGHRSSTCRRG